MLLEGKFMFEKYLSEQIAAVQSEDSNHNQSYQTKEKNAYHSASMN